MELRKQVFNVLNHLFNVIQNAVFPRRCPICDEPHQRKVIDICRECRRKLKYIKPPYCVKCGKSLYTGMEQSVGNLSASEQFCHDCRNSQHAFLSGRALYEYDSVAAAIYRFKYENRREYAEFFGREIAFYLEDVILAWKAEALVPVPLHKKRFRSRGYNQADLLAKAIGEELNIPVKNNLVIRGKNTVAQKNLSAAKRQNNLKRAFLINSNDVKLKTIIVIDDIYTTGSTIDAMAQVLIEHGVERVFFIALAIGRGAQ